MVLFQSIESSSRRKDLHQALTANMKEIVDFLLHLLEQQLIGYKQHSSVACNSGNDQAHLYCKLARSILLTLYVHVDWISISLVMVNDGQLLETCCLLLTDENLRQAAADCLLQVILCSLN